MTKGARYFAKNKVRVNETSQVDRKWCNKVP